MALRQVQAEHLIAVKWSAIAGVVIASFLLWAQYGLGAGVLGLLLVFCSLVWAATEEARDVRRD